ncbi:SGNH/GDSL hydrolase family protein [Pseudarthrobacter sp. TAF60_1]|uniref:SGNH/GDSL hydrolase family protein n=1 Tax=Pseudarthrobacter sp. TAF60_1 TaxID=3233071 RepID=UPI003F976378
MATSAVRRRRSAFAAGLATMAMALGFAAVPAEAAPPPKADYVALGDSYTAGTGAGPFDISSAPRCLQSRGGYADIVGNTGRVNLEVNAACNGALLSPNSPLYMADTSATTVAEQILANGGPLAAAEFVTITAGGNDVGFSSVVLTCATQPQNCAAVLPPTATLTDLRVGLAETYGAVRTAAPTAKIAVLGYPRLFDASVSVPNVDPSVLNALNTATDALNATIASAANDAGVQFVDVTNRFIGHAANSADPWIVFTPDNLMNPQNLHPNPAGYSLGYAAATMGAVKPAQLARR